MKKLILIMILGLLAAPVLAVPTLKFAEAINPAGDWDYTAIGINSGTLDFDPLIIVTTGLGVTDPTVEPLIGMEVLIPDLTVSFDGTNYILTPVWTNIDIVDPVTSTVYFTGTLGTGIWAISGTTSTGYPTLTADITAYFVTQTTPTASPTLDAIIVAGLADLPIDMAISMDIAGADILTAITNVTSISGGAISGSMAIVPAPGAILLGGIGVSFVGWLRRRRTL